MYIQNHWIFLLFKAVGSFLVGRKYLL